MTIIGNYFLIQSLYFFRNTGNFYMRYLLIVNFLFIYLNVTAQNFQWAHDVGSAGTEYGYDISTDRYGNSYFTGWFSDSITFGSTVLKTKNASLFIVKYNSAGNIVWVRQDSGSSNVVGISIKNDTSGNIFLCGRYSKGNVFFTVKDSLFSNAQIAFFIAKYDSSGKFIWAINGGDSVGSTLAMNIDNRNYIYVTGSFKNSCVLGQSLKKKKLKSTSNESIFIAKYDSLGNLIWTQISNSNGTVTSTALDADSSGNVYITGYFDINLKGGAINVSGKADIFILKLDSSGIIQWLKHAGGSNADYGYGIKCFPEGRFYIVGQFTNNAKFDNISIGGNLKGKQALYAFVAFYSVNGKLKWVKKAGADSGQTIAKCISLHNQYAYLGGAFFQCNAYFGKTLLHNSGGQDLAISKLDSNGTFLWSNGAGKKFTSSVCWANATDSNGNSFCTGYLSGDAIFGKDTLINLGSEDAFILKISDVSLWRDNLIKTKYCSGDSILIPYRVSGIIGPGNTFTAELSDSNGSFDSTVYFLGRVSSAKSGTIHGILPRGLPYSTRYNIHIVSDTPNVTSYFNAQTIQIDSLPNIKVKFDSLVCFGQKDTLSASGGNKYLWKPASHLSSATNNTTLFIADSSRIFKLFATTLAGCKDSQSIFIKVRAPLLIKHNKDTLICPGTKIKLSASASGGLDSNYSISWDSSGIIINKGGTLIVAPLVKTKYYIILNDGCSTTGKDSITVNVYAPLHVNAGKDQGICPGYPNYLYAKGSGGDSTHYNYTWDSSGFILGKTSTLSVKPATTTIFKVVLNDHCSLKPDSALVKVYRTRPVSIMLSPDTSICYGATAKLRAFGSGGDSLRYQFRWDSGGTILSATDTFNIYKLPPTYTHQFRCIISDSCSLHSDTAFVKVKVGMPLKIQMPKDTSICKGITLSLLAKASGGTGNFLYQWDSGGALLSNTYTLITQLLAPSSTHQFRCILKDGCALPDTGFVKISVRPALSIQVSKDTTVCYGSSPILHAIAHGGDSTHYLFSWDSSNLILSSSNIFVIHNLSASYTHQFHCTLTDGCTSDTLNDSVAIKVLPALQIKTIKDTAVCQGDTLHLLLSANGGNGGPYVYDWGGGFVSSNNVIIKISSDTILKIRISDQCSTIDSFNVNVHSNALPTIHWNLMPDSGCAPLPVTFSNSLLNDSTEYSFRFMDSSSVYNAKRNYLFTHIFNPGNYATRIYAKNLLGCVKDSILTPVLAFAKTGYNFRAVPEIMMLDNGAIQFYPLNYQSDSIQWLFGDGTTSNAIKPSHNYNDTGTFLIYLLTTNNKGCIDTTYGTVRIEPQIKLFFPNVFTPDNSLLNDIWFPKGIGVLDGEIDIYNRWGEKVFHSDHLNQGWDGNLMFSNTPGLPGIYIYLVSARDYAHQIHRYSGNLLLMKNK